MRLPATDRLVSGMAVLAIEALFAELLLLGLAMEARPPVEDAFKMFSIASRAKPPEEHIRATRKAQPRNAAHAGRPNLKARPVEIVQPPPLVPVPIATTIVAAPVAGDGPMPFAGMANRPDLGTGARGIGSGLGSGGDGAGDGGGGGGGTAPRRTRGRIRDGDYPHDLWAAGVGGTVSVRYHVEVDGRATDCGITGSSGNTDLDALTCRLIEQRFRYRPALDEHGRPVRSIIVENHSWIIDDSELKSPQPATTTGQRFPRL